MIANVKYVEISTYLADLVDSRLSPGDRIPSERALCQRFGVSRMTVRQAVDVLVNEGVLVRQQGRGTFVAQQKLDLQLRITSFGQEMRMRGMVPSTKLLETDEAVPPTHIAQALALSEDAKTYYVRRLRYADDVPMCVEESWLPHALLPGFFDPAPPDSLYGDLQVRGFRPTWGEDTIESVNLDRAQAALLDVEVGAASIVVTRRTFAEDVPVEFAVSYYRGDRYKLWVPIAQPLSPIHPSSTQRKS
ncbi:GntR family transcriptional regulator [Nanchangia anserum]|uniref:GntR family transcriptional regulator n=1 Tax=Nanchangia anserum TaxID=2692125 RepID=A0A8I0GF50_9ACTO|nr:GntR family transcriptional regulator [Nanchangia anserum]MBD3689697.1 GntR family transcriptional regulator [Nanchangia anserum]QOX81872.1 GntR family transcriptional regulator [Nanchangia anserum]